MKTKPEWYYQQSAVIPYREKNGQLEILLITSRKKGNWIIPKGIIEIGMSAEDSAVKEAEEEAGIIGAVHNKVVGEYTYKKWGNTCEVKVFPFKVKDVLNKWPEDNFRKRKWFSAKEAVKKVKMKKIAEILDEFQKNFSSYKLQ